MSKPKLGLGKGLGALIPEIRDEVVYPVDSTMEIDLEKIKPNPQQPRTNFDEGRLKELAETIRAYGVLQPVILQKKNEYYYLVTGERRFRAALLAGLKTIPAIIKDYDAQQSMEIALVENLQRENLNPIEEATAYKKLLEEFNYLQEELAQKLGKSRSTIANIVRLLALDEKVQGYLAEGSLTVGQARPLLALDNAAEQQKLALKTINEKLNARKVEKLVRDCINKKEAENEAEAENAKVEAKDVVGVKDLLFKEIEEKLRGVYGTKVMIKTGTREGKVELSFYGEDDLERLTGLLLKEGL